MKKMIICCLIIVNLCFTSCESKKNGTSASNIDENFNCSDYEYVIENCEVIHGTTDRAFHSSIEALVDRINKDKNESLIKGKVVSTRFYYGWDVNYGYRGYTVYEIAIQKTDKECNYLDFKSEDVVYVCDDNIYLSFKNEKDEWQKFSNYLGVDISDLEQLKELNQSIYFEMVLDRNIDFMLHVRNYSALLKNENAYYLDICAGGGYSETVLNITPLYGMCYQYPENDDLYEMYEKYSAEIPTKEVVDTARGIKKRIENK